MSRLSERFAEAGSMTKAFSYTDQQLKEMVEVLGCVIAYLKARGDSDIVVSRLSMELNTYEDFQNARKTYL